MDKIYKKEEVSVRNDGNRKEFKEKKCFESTNHFKREAQFFPLTLISASSNVESSVRRSMDLSLTRLLEELKRSEAEK